MEEDSNQSPDGGRVLPFERIDWVDRFIQPFVRETTLWPVLLVLIGHAGVLIAIAILEALRDRNPLGWLALVALLMLSLRVPAYEIGRWRRPAALSAVTAASWLLAAGLAAIASHYGAY